MSTAATAIIVELIDSEEQVSYLSLIHYTPLTALVFELSLKN